MTKPIARLCGSSTGADRPRWKARLALDRSVFRKIRVAPVRSVKPDGLTLAQRERLALSMRSIGSGFVGGELSAVIKGRPAGILAHELVGTAGVAPLLEASARIRKIELDVADSRRRLAEAV